MLPTDNSTTGHFFGGVGPEAGTGDGEVGPAVDDRQVLGNRVEDGKARNPRTEDRPQRRNRLDGDERARPPC